MSVENLTTKDGFSLYPNPSLDKITVEISRIPSKGELSILNINSQELIHQAITQQKTVIDVNALSSGIYIVKVTGEKGVQLGKFVKQ